jgi:hypothetical protein
MKLGPRVIYSTDSWSFNFTVIRQIGWMVASESIIQEELEYIELGWINENVIPRFTWFTALLSWLLLRINLPLQKSNQLLVLWSIHRWSRTGVFSLRNILHDLILLVARSTLRTDDTNFHLLVVVRWFCQLNLSCGKLKPINGIVIARFQV